MHFVLSSLKGISMKQLISNWKTDQPSANSSTFNTTDALFKCRVRVQTAITRIDLAQMGRQERYVIIHRVKPARIRLWCSKVFSCYTEGEKIREIFQYIAVCKMQGERFIVNLYLARSCPGKRKSWLITEGFDV